MEVKLLDIKINHKIPLAYYALATNLKNYICENTVIVCIGTDKFIGDSLGPLVGSILKENNFPLPVYGTIDNPIHALNIDSKIKEIKDSHKDSLIIGIDACLGLRESIGEIHIRDYPIRPGKGVGKTLQSVGDISLVGIVDSNDNTDFFSSRSIRLSLIYNIAKTISYGFIHAYHLNFH
ncbi:spore protease YyaC [Clostridium chrysemydis]|uniref:spore protease YyaC n=1 Tax=Clostridium chrysemydis TaxID=2665504 RepID=UPI003F376D3D